jgi:predicted HicB family RNase H-like nuclease
MWPMVASEFIKARVPPNVKRRVAVVAEREYLSESAWLKRVVMRQLEAVDAADEAAGAVSTAAVFDTCRKQPKERPGPCAGRIYVRLRPEDCLLLSARAQARGMRSATYVSVLTRSHLRRLAPLPKDELLAFRRSIGEVAAIGRNINQIARIANEVGRLPGSVREEFRAMLTICEALRDHTKGLLKANLASWESGIGEDG